MVKAKNVLSKEERMVEHIVIQYANHYPTNQSHYSL